MLAAIPAQAELTLCNRTSYQMEAAFGLEKRANVATRGWFRIDPGQCRRVAAARQLHQARVVHVAVALQRGVTVAPVARMERSRLGNFARISAIAARFNAGTLVN